MFNSEGKKYYENKIFLGVVEEIYDPQRMGRIKVRVQGAYNDLAIDDIPWASPFRSLDGRTFSIPSIGKAVNVIFPNGNIYAPEYIYSENYNINLQDKLKSISEDEYSNFVALLFDHRTQIYSDDIGLTMDYFDNVIRIKKDSIDLKLKDNNQKVNIGHSDCDQSAVLGTNFFRWFDRFVDTLLQPTSIIANLGGPAVKVQIDALLTEYKSTREQFVSNHVKIIDNNKIVQDAYDKNRLDNPSRDDQVKVNDTKLLNITPETLSNETPQNIENQKELNDKIKSERELSVLENKYNEPKLSAVSYDEFYDDFDENIISQNEEKFAAEVNSIINGDPYSGIFGSNTSITNIESFQSIPISSNIYGTYKHQSQDTSINNIWDNRKGRTIDTYNQKIEYYSGYEYDDNFVYTSNSTVEFVNSSGVAGVGDVATNKVILLPNSALAGINSSYVLTKMSLGGGKYTDISDLNLNKVSIKGNDIVKSMNEFIIDALFPFADWLKIYHLDIYNSMLFSSAVRGYIHPDGSPTSQHFRGQAVDIGQNTADYKQKNDGTFKLYNAILEWCGTVNRPYDQLLLESRNQNSCWVHWSYKRTGFRNMSRRMHNDRSIACEINADGKILKPFSKDKALLYQTSLKA